MSKENTKSKFLIREFFNTEWILRESLEPDGSGDDGVEQLDVQLLVGPGLGVQEEDLVGDSPRIEALPLQVDLAELEGA